MKPQGAQNRLTALSPLKKYRFWVLFAPFLKVFECVCELIVPIMVALLIKRGLTLDPEYPDLYQNEVFIFGVGGTLLGLALLGFLATMVTQFLAAKISSEYAYDLKETLFGKIHSLSVGQLDSFGRNKALNLITSDALFMQNGVQMFMRLLARSPFLIIGSIIASFLVNPLAGLIVLIALLACSLTILVVFLATPKRYAELQKQLDALSSLGEDGILGARVIRAFGKEEKQSSAFHEASGRYRSLALVVARINAFINPLTFAFVSLAIVFILYVGGYQGTPGNSLGVGDIVALVSYLTQSLAALVMFTRLVTSLSKAVASKKRIDQFLALESDLVDGPLDEEPSLKKGDLLFCLEHVHVNFGGEEDVLSDINLQIRSGEHIGIIGGTGSGKSTILSLLERFLDPSQGKVFFKGHDAKQSKLKNIRKEIALVSQKPQIFKGTVRSNLLCVRPDASEEELNEAICLSLAEEFVSRYSDRLDHPIEENGQNLSGGQKQRLLLARSFLAKRPILLLDDATSALDYRSDAEVRANLAKIPGLTLVMVSQRATSLKGCDRIYVLDKGKVVDVGDHQSLLDRCPTYREIYQAQVESR